MDVIIEQIDPRSHLLEKLADEARAQGYFFIDRLLDEARCGKNLFENFGECFCGVFAGHLLVGCGGINKDPYVDQNIGRLRHVYVVEAYRRNGIAAALVRDLLERSKHAFDTVRLRASDDNANTFYDTLGFKRTDHETATHYISI